MNITKDILLHLNKTMYFDTAGLVYFDHKDAERANKLYENPLEIVSIRPQKCYALKYDEITVEQRNYAAQFLKGTTQAIEELLFLVSKKDNEILFMTSQSVLNQWLLTDKLSIADPYYMN